LYTPTTVTLYSKDVTVLEIGLFHVAAEAGITVEVVVWEPLVHTQRIVSPTTTSVIFEGLNEKF
jgi:hypothetical protein